MHRTRSRTCNMASHPGDKRAPALALVALALGASSLLTACDHAEGAIELPPAHETASVAPVQVVAIEPERERIARTIAVTGHIRPVREASLGTDVVARIVQVNAEAGDRVSAGDVLVRLNASRASAGVTQALAGAGAVAAQLEQLEADVARLEPLVNGGVVAGAELERLRSQLQATEANLRAANAAVEAARDVLPSFEIRAPFDGVAEEVEAEVGEVAVAGGPALVRLLDLDTVEAELSVPEVALRALEGQPQVRARVRALGETVDGQVVRIANEFDAAAHAAPVVVAFDNADGRLRAGMFIEVSLTTSDARESLVLRGDQVRGSAGDYHVLVAEDGVATARPVEVEQLPDGRFEVLTGLEAGDVLIAAVSGSVHQGSRVTLTEEGNR